MTEENRKDEILPREREPDFEEFKEFVKMIAAVPKEEADAIRAEHEREKKEKTDS